MNLVDPTGHSAQDPQQDNDGSIDVVRTTIHDKVQQLIEQARKNLEGSRNKVRDFWNTPSASNYLPCFAQRAIVKPEPYMTMLATH